ncbi:hypothetical protein LTR56_025290 [Elasticomyces elasticus]|nr:hypothetical protein LTR56_025290 [Elasticomyces elasticus]KAK3618885.1 hypothetical protein LTR22_026209 [Elasticomyces elasticus]KAK4907875.1 hypothetical protein LTR49_023149 [Elasticomyces elasticus]KAK5740879.1 hypothetical protein LTS12_024795 [Elasticomyces elasticus]
MGSFRISDNHVLNSSNTHITHHVHNGPDTDNLRTWMSAEARKAKSRRTSLPDRYQPRLTERIMQETCFETCLSQKAGTVVLKGSMGAGKTTTARGLIKAMRSRVDMITAYVLFGFNLTAGYEPRKVMMRFLHQVVDTTDEEQRALVLDLYERYPDECPSVEETADALCAVIDHIVHNQNKTTCIVLDGLDEFGDWDKLASLLGHLARIQERTKCGILMTTRLDEGGVTRSFAQATYLEISASAKDIENYVCNFSPGHTVAQLLARDPECMSQIVSSVVCGSGGLFLLATLNTHHIMRAVTKHDFRTAIDEVRAIMVQPLAIDESALERVIFPKAFDRHFRRLFASSAQSAHSRQQVQDAKDILAFMRDAARPLHVDELLYMLALRGRPENVDESTLRNVKDLPLITQGMMNVTSNGLVQFIHPWLLKYLWKLRDRTLPDSNIILAKLCLRYLSSSRFSDGPCSSKVALDQRLAASPFLDYAARYWPKHYASATKNASQSVVASLQSSALDFLQRHGSVSCARQVMLIPDHILERRNRLYVRDLAEDKVKERYCVLVCRSTKAKRPGYVDLYNVGRNCGLHLVALLNLDDLAKTASLSMDKSLLNAVNGSAETPLHIAIVHSGPTLVNHLVSNGADLNAQDDEGRSPWHIAAAYGKADAIKIMLNQPPSVLNVNAPVQLGSARWNGHSYVITSAEPGKVSKWTERAISGSTAIHLAARNGHIGVLELILEDGRADFALEDGDGMTAFHKACKYGRLDVVKLLMSLDNASAARRSKKDGRIGLHLACKYSEGHEVAKYLLSVSPESCHLLDHHGEVALHHAAVGQDARNLQLLLQLPTINANVTNHKHKTPLMLAAFNPNAGFDMLMRHNDVELPLKIGSMSLPEFVRERRQLVARNVLRCAQERSTGHDQAQSHVSQLGHLAERISVSGPRPLTPLVYR